MEYLEDYKMLFSNPLKVIHLVSKRKVGVYKTRLHAAQGGQDSLSQNPRHAKA